MPNEKFRFNMGRLSELQWSELLGKNLFDTLKYCQSEITGDDLTDVLLNLYSDEELIKKNSWLSTILSVLNDSDRQELSERLRIPTTGTNGTIPIDKIKSREKKIIMDYFGMVSEKKTICEPIEPELICRPVFELRDYQRQVIEDAMKKLDQDGRCLLYMPTGSGKTTTAMDIVSRMIRSKNNSYILWLAYSQELCQQADETIRKMWKVRGDRPIFIHDLFGTKVENALPEPGGDHFIICTMAELTQIEKKQPTILSRLANHISMVIFDEAHQSVADTYQTLINQIIINNTSCKLIGLTATPARKFGDEEENKKLPELYYNNIVEIKTGSNKTAAEMLTDEGYLSKIEWIIKDGTSNDIKLTDSEIRTLKIIRGNDDPIPKSIIDKLSNSIKRNIAIVDCAKELIEGRNKMRLILFANSIEHGRTITSLLKVCGFDASFVDGNTPAEQRRKIIDDFKVISDEPKILCNFNLLTTGVDIPNIDSGIIARPLNSAVLFSQMVGRMIRGVRSAGGTESAIIATITDGRLPDYNSMYNFWIKEWGQ